MKLLNSAPVFALLFVSLFSLSVEANGLCKTPPAIKYGKHDGGKIYLYGQKGVATYYCFPGYVLVGSAKVSCYFGVWGRLPVCVRKITCPKLSAPRYGSVTFSVKVGSKATYSCKSGFILKGSATRVCGRDGYWSGEAPTCKRITCPKLFPPRYGSIKFSNGLYVNSKATYSCQSGFLLQGDSSRVCKSNGYWSGRAPICKRRVTCPKISAPRYGFIKFSNGLYVGSKAAHSCRSGFILKGDKTRVCRSNGYWSGRTPICKRIQCPKLFPPKYGFIKFSDGLNVGSKATYSCRSGFILQGKAATRKCQSNGYWTGNAPRCKRIKFCPRLVTPKYGGVKLSNGLYVGSVASYYCQKGYVLKGDRSRTCGSDGDWIGYAPTCVYH